MKGAASQDTPTMEAQNTFTQNQLSFGTKYSVLNLVDLAGSERLSDVGNKQIEETSHINKSLFVLSNVVYKLSENMRGTSSYQQHIPYRDSKLTQILRSALGGNSLTAVICTVSPNFDHISLTQSTLRFASRAKAVQNKAAANEVIDDNQNDSILMRKFNQVKIAQLEKKIASLEDQLKNSYSIVRNLQS